MYTLKMSFVLQGLKQAGTPKPGRNVVLLTENDEILIGKYRFDGNWLVGDVIRLQNATNEEIQGWAYIEDVHWEIINVDENKE